MTYFRTGFHFSLVCAALVLAAPLEAEAQVTSYADQASLDLAFPGLTVEDFEAVKPTAPAGPGCESPLDEFTDDVCYAPGGILPGIVFEATTSPSSNGFTLNRSGLNGAVSTYFVAGRPNDEYIINFDVDTFAAGIDLTCYNAGSVDVTVYDRGGSPLNTTTSACISTGTDFFGISSVVGIAQIVISPGTATYVGSDNLAFQSGGGGDPLVVTNTNDSGAGSLRQAIAYATGNAGIDPIEFAIPGLATDVHTIALSTMLDIADPDGVVIDGYTQLGASPNSNNYRSGTNAQIRIELDGTGITNGDPMVRLSGAGSVTLRGLAVRKSIEAYGSRDAVRSAGGGIELTSGGHFVEGNFIGVDAGDGAGLPGGTRDGGFGGAPGASYAIRVLSSGNTLGGVTPPSRNVISGSTSGIHFEASGNEVYGNYIGTNRYGGGAIPNVDGISEIGSGGTNTIGGADKDGDDANDPHEGNTISGNTGSGISIAPIPATSGWIIEGNYIGTRSDGFNPLGNAGDGIRLAGGLHLVADNVISNSGGFAGVFVIDGSDHLITLNSIYGNQTAGIRLEIGSNGGVEQPDLANASIDAFGDLTVDVSSADAGLLEFFVGDDGQGRTFVGASAFSGGTAVPITLPGGALIEGDEVVATLTATGKGTSEFGVAAPVTTTLDELEVVNTNDSGVGSLRGAIQYANATANGAEPDEITFNIPGAGVQVIELSSNLPPITDPVRIDGITQGTATCGTDEEFNGRQLLVALNGAAALSGGSGNGGGIHIESGGVGSIIRGLEIRNFPDYGIYVDYADGVYVECNNIGHGPTGTFGNRKQGVFVDGSEDATIGGSGPLGNVIAGNGTYELNFRYDGGHLAEGNYIGASPLGGTPVVVLSNLGIPNQDRQTLVLEGSGVEVVNNVVGGPGTLVSIGVNGALPATLHGNWIGVARADEPLAGGDYGIYLDGTGNSGAFQIGGAGPGEANTIQGVSAQAILVQGGTSGVIQGNSLLNNALGSVPPGYSVPAGIDILSTGSWDILDNTVADSRYDGLRLTQPCPAPGPPCEISGNVVHGNGDSGIYLEEFADGYTISDNRVGINDLGVASPNTTGVIVRSANNQINGNTISGNLGTGLQLASPRSTGNVVAGNFIGTDPTGSNPVANGCSGVELTEGASQNLIGGSLGAKNVISANGCNGVLIAGNIYDDLGLPRIAYDNSVSFNHIGVDASGSFGVGVSEPGHLGNGGNGVEIVQGPDDLIFGTNGRPFDNTISDNVISNNVQDGVRLLLAGDGNEISDNIIGTGANRTAPLPNGWNGVHIAGIGTGGHSIVRDNTIAFHTGSGIILKDAGGPPYVSAAILGNSIFGNGLIGIDLTNTPGNENPQGDLLTENDFDDSDDGPNTLLNFPKLLKAEGVHNGDGLATLVTVEMTLTNGPSAYRIEIFEADADSEEGALLLQSQTLTGPFDPNEVVRIEFVPPAGTLPVGAALVATATVNDGSGNFLTSEFSRPVTIDDYVPRGYATQVIPASEFGIFVPSAVAAEDDGGFLVALGQTVVRLKASYDPADDFPDEVRDVGGGAEVDDIVIIGSRIVAIHSDEVELIEGGALSSVSLTNATAGAYTASDDCLYVAALDKVWRSCGAALSFTEWATLPEPATAIAADASGAIYVGTSNGPSHEIYLVPAAAPNSAELIWAIDDSPTSMDFAEDGRLFVSTQNDVLSGFPRDAGPTQFLPIPDNSTFPNSLSVGPRSQLFVADQARGTVLVLGLAADQAQEELETLEFRVSEAVLDLFDDGIVPSPRDLIHDAVENAIASWQTAGGFVGRVRYDRFGPEGAARATIGDDENTIALSDDRLFLGSSTLGVASKLMRIPVGGDPEDAEVIKADILLNSRFHPQTGTSGELGVFATEVSTRDHDVQGVLTHEVGHVLGLIHSGRPDATMFYNLPRDARNLTVDDEAAILRKVGADPATMARITGQVISGNVDSPANTPVGGALVIATDQDGESIHAYTDRDGNFDLSFLPQGTYDVGLFALDGSVFNTRIPLVPARISRYLDVIANERDFLEEYWSGVGLETSTDNRSDSVPVILGPTTAQGGVDFVTNIDLKPPTVLNYTVGTDPSAASLDPTIGITFSERIQDAPSATVRPVGCAAGCAEEQTLEVIFDSAGRKFAVASTSVSLLPETAYLIRVTGLVDLADNAQNTTSTFVFTTRPPDLTPPELVSSTPAEGATGVDPFSLVTATFSEALSVDSVGEPDAVRLLDESGTAVLGKISLPATNVVAFSPDVALSADVLYTLDLNVSDPSGNETSITVPFTTVSNPTLAITARGPADGTVGVALGTNIYVDFNEAVAEMSEGYPVALSIAGPLGEKGAPLPGSTQLVENGKRLVFIPTSILDSGVTYRFDVEAGLVDASTPGEAVPEAVPVEWWTFTTTATTAIQSLEGLSPSVGSVGSYVTVVGSGFTPIADANSVSFSAQSGTVSAEVVAAVDNGLVVRVPEGTVSGTVLVNGQTILSNGLGQLQFSVYEALQTFDTGTAKAETESNPSDVKVSPDGTLAVVPNAGSGTVSLINIETGATETVFVEKTPLRVVISPDGERAYVTNYNSNSVSVIDLECAVAGGVDCVVSIPVEFNPIGIAVAPDGSRVYVGNYTSKTVSIIDTSDPEQETYNQTVRKLETEELVGKVVSDPDGAEKLGTEANPTHVEAHPDGTGIWIGTHFGVIAAEINLDISPADWGVTILVTEEAAGSVKASPDGGVTILVTEGNAGSTNQDPDGAGTIAETESTAGHVTSSPDGSVVLFTMGTGEVLIYAVPENPFGGEYQAVTKINSEANASQVEMSPDGTLIYVTSFETGTVSIYRFGRGLGSAGSDPLQVSGSDYGVILIEVKEVGLQPDGIAYSAVNDLAVIANSGSDDLTILRFDGQSGFSVALEQDEVEDTDTDGDGISDIRTDVADQLSALVAGSSDKDEDDFLEALESATKNLDPELWAEDGSPSEKKGHKVFDNDKKTIHELEQVIDRDNLWFETASGLVQLLWDLDSALVREAIDQAQADLDALQSTFTLLCEKKDKTCKRLAQRAKKATKELEKARKELAKAEDEAADGDFEKAIDRLKKAWRNALKSIDDVAGKGFVYEDEEDLPIEFDLSPNYPNPFNPATTIEFALPEMAEVRLEVFDILGRRVQTLVNGQLDAGYHSVQFNADRLASGVYLYRIQAGAYSKVHRMVLMK